MRSVFLAAGVLILSGGGAWAQADTTPIASPGSQQAAVYDPIEGTNRSLFGVHQSIDRNIVGPVARGYKAVTPQPVRKGVRNVLNNLGEPVTFVNDVLQGRPTRAGETATRFVANSTVGVLGVFDVATGLGVQRHDEDFGQTLGVWGVKPGPYVFIPVLGPTNARDLTGRVVDVLLNPINALEFDGARAARTTAAVTNGVDARARADDEVSRLNASATDPYATYRSLYAQNRAARIANGEGSVQELPDFENVPVGPPPQPATPRRRRR